MQTPPIPGTEPARDEWRKQQDEGFAKARLDLAREARAEASSETLKLMEERALVSKRDVLTGTVKVSTRTETYEDVAEVTLERDIVDVTRVPIDRLVDTVPTVRTEGDTTIVPVIEERLVIVKQVYLKEELHIRHQVGRDVSRTSVQLRRQVAVVERLDAEGRVIDDPA